MRKLYQLGFLLAIVGSIGLMNCDQDQSEAEYNLEDIPGPTGEPCCAQTFQSYVSGESPPNGQFLTLALLQSDTMVAWGIPEFVPAGVYDSVELYLTIGHLDDVPEGEYQQVILAYDTESDIGTLKKRRMRQELGYSPIPSYVTAPCDTCCTTSLSRYICLAFEDIGNLMATAANVETRWGKLCGKLSIQAHSSAWIGIQDSLPGANGWTPYVQMGYMRRRASPTITQDYVYVEHYVTTAPGHITPRHIPLDGRDPLLTVVQTPSEGSTHNYECRVLPQSGTVQFWYDGNLVYNKQDAFYLSRTLRYATWEGEINGLETDMPGTKANPCNYVDCAYMVDNGSWQYVSASFNSTKIKYNQPTGGRPKEWDMGFAQGGNSMWYWDEDTLK